MYKIQKNIIICVLKCPETDKGVLNVFNKICNISIYKESKY